MGDDLFKSVEESLKKNLADFHQKQNEQRQQVVAEKIQRAEEYYFARKVAQPAEVKSFFRLKPDSDLEEKLVNLFVGLPVADPREWTMVMEGKPFVALVAMDNGLKYRAAMTRMMGIHWPKGAPDQISPTQVKLLLDKQASSPNLPVIHADKMEYVLFLWPVRKDGRVNESEYLEVRWGVRDRIATLQETEGKTASDGISTTGGVQLRGTALCPGAFSWLNDDILGMRTHYPRHFHRLFAEVQKAYDFARTQKTLGKAIYAVLDPTKSPRGKGCEISLFPTGGRHWFDIPEIQVVNPNQPLRLIHQRQKPVPQRLALDRVGQVLERIKTRN